MRQAVSRHPGSSSMAERAPDPCGQGASRTGFTLIEILIVISIIALLSSFVLVAVTRGKQGASEAIATTQVGSLSSNLERYVEEEGEYPGMTLKADPERNDFPLLFNALFGERRPRGPGGRSAPYGAYKEDQVIVYDSDTETYRKAKRNEINNPKVEKFLEDPWGHPYVYRGPRALWTPDCR